MLILIVQVFRGAEVKVEPVYQKVILINPVHRELNQEIEVHRVIILQREAAAVEIEAEAVRETVIENHHLQIVRRQIIRRQLLHHRRTVRRQVQDLTAAQDLREVRRVLRAVLPDHQVIREEEDNS